MSDVIRDAIIRIRYETQKAKIEAPELSQTIKAHEEVAKAAGRAAKAERDIGEAAREAGDRLSSVTLQHRSHAEDSARGYDDFGRRAEQSFVQGGRGALQFSRGLALLATSSGEATQKMLQDLIKIEAASQLTMGAANLLRFAGGFGAAGIAAAGLTATVAAGAVAWDVYKSKAEAATKALEEQAKAAKATSEAERQMIQQREQNQSKGRAEQTDANFEAAKRHEAQRKEIADREQAIKDHAELGANTDKAIADAETRARAHEARATKIEAEGMGAAIDSQGRVIGGLDPERERKEAQRQSDIAQDTRRQRKSQIESDQDDAQREKAILESQHADAVQDIHQRAEHAIAEQAREEANASDATKARREVADARFRRQQAAMNHGFVVSPFTGAFGAGDVMGAAAFSAIGHATPQEIRQAPIREREQRDVQREDVRFTESVQTLVSKITAFNDEMIQLKAKLDAGASR